MPYEVIPQASQPTGMPRREFIRKSLLASGGTFVGMASVGKFTLPELGRDRNPQVPTSSDEEDSTTKVSDPKDKDDWTGKNGISRWNKSVQTTLDELESSDS